MTEAKLGTQLLETFCVQVQKNHEATKIKGWHGDWGVVLGGSLRDEIYVAHKI